MLNKRKAHAHTFFQPMVSAFSRKSRRVIIRPYFLMRPWWEPEHLQHRRQHPHALAETFKHFIFYDTIRTPACAAQRSRKYIAEQRRNACERDKKSICSSREKETWNRTTNIHRFTLLPISSTAQSETLLGQRTDTTECVAKCEVHNSRYETEHSCKGYETEHLCRAPSCALKIICPM